MHPKVFGGVTFNIGPRYQPLKLLGVGAYGSVVSALDTLKQDQKVR